MFSLSDLVSIDTNHLWMKISSAEKEKVWQQAQHHSNPIARYNAYLNRVCLNLFLTWLEDWLREESRLKACVFPSEESLPSIWEIVEGTAIQVGNTRIVLIPTEDIDSETLCVPQEWVDNRSWVANYYIGVQVNLADDDDCWMRVSGFATHRQLKNQGTYDACTHTYSLAIEELTEDLTLLFATLGLHLLAEVPSEVTLSEAEAQNLLTTFGDVTVYSPRLRSDIPFTHWTALISNEQWRQQLYNLRLNSHGRADGAAKSGTLSQVNAVTYPALSVSQTRVNISHWLDNIFEAGWQAVEALLRTQALNLEFSTRSTGMLREIYDNPGFGVTSAKLIDLGMQLADQQVVLMVKIVPRTETEIDIRLRVCPTSGQIYLPPSLQLTVWDETGTCLEAEARSIDNWIQLEFSGEKGEYFSVKVALGDVSVTEDFVI